MEVVGLLEGGVVGGVGSTTVRGGVMGGDMAVVDGEAECET